MSNRHEHEPAHKKPINKATMDEPQEEFIAPYAAIVEPDEEYGGEFAHAAHLSSREEQGTKAG